MGQQPPPRAPERRGARPTSVGLTPQERFFSLAGVLLALLLAGLDQTIVSTAGPAIQRDLRIPPSLYPWITTAYLVAATVTVPIYGKLSDSFGRKPILLAGVSLFLLGSLLCGLAPGTMSLVAFRAVQGLGAGSLFTTAFAVIADIFPPAERGKYMGLIGAVMAVASVVGPLAGGLITDQFGWHWVFFINLPVGAIAVWFIAARMPRLGAPATGARSSVDVPGAAALVVGVVPLLVALSLGRAESAANRVGFAWGSWPMLAMLTLSALGLAAFYIIERRAADPIIDLRLFRHRVIGLGTAATFVLGAAFLFSVVFLPLFLVNVVGVSATRAGLTMMPLTMGIVAGSVLTGQIVARFGHSRRLMLGSLVLLGIGFAVMAFTLTPDSTQTDVTLKMILVGLGIGPQFPVYTLVIQHAAPPEDIGVVTAATTFSRSLGQVIGVAAFGTIFASVFAASVERRVSAILSELPTHVRALVSPTIAPTTGAREQMSVVYDTARAKAQIGDLLAGRSGSSVEVRSGPIDEGRATEDASVDPRAAHGAVDEIARAHEWAFTDAISTLYRGAIGLIALAFLLSIPIPDAPLHGVRAPRRRVEIG